MDQPLWLGLEAAHDYRSCAASLFEQHAQIITLCKLLLTNNTQSQRTLFVCSRCLFDRSVGRDLLEQSALSRGHPQNSSLARSHYPRANSVGNFSGPYSTFCIAEGY